MDALVSKYLAQAVQQSVSSSSLPGAVVSPSVRPYVPYSDSYYVRTSERVRTRTHVPR